MGQASSGKSSSSKRGDVETGIDGERFAFVGRGHEAVGTAGFSDLVQFGNVAVVNLGCLTGGGLVNVLVTGRREGR